MRKSIFGFDLKFFNNERLGCTHSPLERQTLVRAHAILPSHTRQGPSTLASASDATVNEMMVDNRIKLKLRQDWCN